MLGYKGKCFGKENLSNIKNTQQKVDFFPQIQKLTRFCKTAHKHKYGKSQGDLTFCYPVKISKRKIQQLLPVQQKNFLFSVRKDSSVTGIESGTGIFDLFIVLSAIRRYLTAKKLVFQIQSMM